MANQNKTKHGQEGISILVYGDSGRGKALANGSGVLTPDRGFVPIEELAVGDAVIDPDGGSAEVEGVFPQGVKPMLAVNRRGGGSVSCSEDHWWNVTQGIGDGTTRAHVGCTARTLPVLLRSGSRKKRAVWLPAISEKCRELVDIPDTALVPCRVESVTPSEPAECTCIRVSSKHGLFVTDDFIVTHNSTDVGYTFRKAAWLQTEPGGLIPVVRCVGYTPQIVHTLFDSDDPVGEFKAVIDSVIIPGAANGTIKTVVLDTGSELAHRIETALHRKTKDGREVYQRVQSVFIESIDLLIKLGIWFVCICHEIGPEVDPSTGNRLRGGPLLPGKKLPRRLPPKFDLVLRADVEHGLTPGSSERVYRCDPLDSDYIMKDRFGVTLPVQPMELAPIVFRILNPGVEPPEELLRKRLNVRTV